MKKIVFIINSVGSGGAETALFNIINAAPADPTLQLHLVLLDDETRMKSIPSTVVVHQLNAKRSLLKSVWQCYRLLAEIKPSVVVSFLVRANVVTSVMRLFSITPRSIVCERMHLQSHLNLQYSASKAKVLSWLPRSLYSKNDVVLGVSSGVTANLVKAFKVKQNKAKTIFNPYDIDKLQSLANQHSELTKKLPERYMVNVARLTTSKDHATLLHAFAKSNTPCSLVILGVGELQDELSAVVTQLKVEDRVHFLGYVDNPYPIIKGAEFFLSTSLNEGFPNALLESMVLGKASIFTSCDSGPAEIFGCEHMHKAKCCEQHQYGVLVPEKDVEQIAAAIDLFDDRKVREHYQSMSQQRASHFTIDNIASQYWHEVLSLADEQGN